MRIKYKVGTKNKYDQKATNSNLLVVFEDESSKTVAENIVRIKTAIKDFGYTARKDSPLLFKNPFSASKLSLDFFFIKYGTRKIVDNIKTRGNRFGFSIKSTEITVRTIPKLIPSQNTRFQKLSRFSLDLMKFIKCAQIVLTTIILSRLRNASKAIRAFACLICLSLCQTAMANDLERLISTQETAYKIPSGLLLALSKVESNMNPNALNIQGRGVVYSSKEEVIKAVKQVLQEGITSIDIGLMQINWHWHGGKFKSLEEMLKPEVNVEYAAKLLCSLYEQHGSWNLAVRYYHSAKPEYYQKYAKKVIITWLNG